VKDWRDERAYTSEGFAQEKCKVGRKPPAKRDKKKGRSNSWEEGASVYSTKPKSLQQLLAVRVRSFELRKKRGKGSQ